MSKCLLLRCKCASTKPMILANLLKNMRIFIIIKLVGFIFQPMAWDFQNYINVILMINNLIFYERNKNGQKIRFFSGGLENNGPHKKYFGFFLVSYLSIQKKIAHLNNFYRAARKDKQGGSRQKSIYLITTAHLVNNTMPEKNKKE